MTIARYNGGHPCGVGEIGKLSVLKIRRLTAYGFESRTSHQKIFTCKVINMTNWGKFATYDAKALNEEVKNLNDGDFPEIPNGKYEVCIKKMELKPTKEKGYPMLAVQFEILEGQFKKQRIFMNQVILMGDQNDKYRVHTANTFLRSLETGIDVSFEGVAEYEELVSKIFEVASELEFVLELGENKGGYKTYKILEVFE